MRSINIEDVNHFSSQRTSSEDQTHKLIIIGFWLTALGWWIEKGLDLVRKTMKMKNWKKLKNKELFLEVSPMPIFVSCSSFMITWFTIIQKYNIPCKNIITSQLKNCTSKLSFQKLSFLAVETFRHFNFFFLFSLKQCYLRYSPSLQTTV